CGFNPIPSLDDDYDSSLRSYSGTSKLVYPHYHSSRNSDGKSCRCTIYPHLMHPTIIPTRRNTIPIDLNRIGYQGTIPRNALKTDLQTEYKRPLLPLHRPSRTCIFCGSSIVSPANKETSGLDAARFRARARARATILLTAYTNLAYLQGNNIHLSPLIEQVHILA
ncbi:unnamed protein product, partial [Rhizoctonia solani]